MKHLKPCEPLDAFFQVQPFSASHISLQFLLLVAPLEFLKVPTQILTSLRFVSGPTNVINACKCIPHSEQSICWSKLLAGVVHVHFAGTRNQSKNRFQTAPLLWAVFIQRAVFSPCNKTLMKIYNCENHHLITTCWGAVSFSSFQE